MHQNDYRLGGQLAQQASHLAEPEGSLVSVSSRRYPQCVCYFGPRKHKLTFFLHAM